jgi:acetyl esterase/lipase
MHRVAVVTTLLAVAVFAQDAVESVFRTWDRDGDGRLTAAELASPWLFAKLDADGDGFVTLAEARAFYARRPRRPAPPPMPALTHHLDLAYHEIDGVAPKHLSLDLYAPEEKGKHPVLVMIHGGGWRIGDKANAGMTSYKVPHFVGHGFVYVSINYRLSTTPEVKHPAHVNDVARALAWVHDHVAKYGGDPDRIFVMGHSAGAHLAALVATDHRRLEAAGKSLAILKGAICLDVAAYDLPRNIREFGAGPHMRRLYETAFGKTEEAWRDASPRHHVAPGKGIPPMLLFHAGRRAAVERLTREMVDALRKAGVPARAIHAPDKNHAGINWCIGQPGDPYTALVMRFLERPQDANTLALGDPQGDAGRDR